MKNYERKKMYENPQVFVIKLEDEDVLTASIGSDDYDATIEDTYWF